MSGARLDAHADVLNPDHQDTRICPDAGSLCLAAPMRWLLLVMLLVLAACDNKTITAPDPTPGTFTYNYTLTSSNLSTGINKAIFISANATAGCEAFGTPVHDFVSGGASANAVSINFTKFRSTWFLWSIYLDKDANSLLSAGDDVWGVDPARLDGICVDPEGNTPDLLGKN
jgi:hypothetical protein